MPNLRRTGVRPRYPCVTAREDYPPVKKGMRYRVLSKGKIGRIPVYLVGLHDENDLDANTVIPIRVFHKSPPRIKVSKQAVI